MLGSSLFFGIGSTNVTSSAGSIVPKTWYYIEAQYSGSQIELFINGSSVGTASNTTNPQSTNFHVGTLGSSWDSSYELDGYVSDLKVVSGTPSGSSTVPTAPLSSSGAALHIKGTDASIIDKSQGANLKLFGNTTGSTTQVKFASSKSIYFDGTGDYLTASNVGSQLSMGSGDFTAETWVYFNSLPSAGAAWNLLFALRDGSNNGIALYVDGPTPHLEPYTSTQQATGSTTLSTGQWYHIAVVRNSGVIYGYVNGNQDFSYSYSTSVGDVDGYFGGFGGVQDCNGYFEDIRVTKGLARYTANFTPPTALLEG
jgi:hypothetical protein